MNKTIPDGIILALVLVFGGLWLLSQRQQSSGAQPNPGTWSSPYYLRYNTPVMNSNITPVLPPTTALATQLSYAGCCGLGGTNGVSGMAPST